MTSDGPERAPISATADRIREMLVTAEAIAKDVRREATEEAERYLAERRREADALVAQRRERFERALEILRDAGPEIERRLGEVTAALQQALGAEEQPRGPAVIETPAADAAASAPDTAAPIDGRAAASQPEVDPAAKRSGGGAPHVRQRALIRATQLAVQGVDRATVQETIEREFELDDGTAIVDEILGD